MANDLTIQGEVVVSADKAEAAFSRVGAKADAMAKTVEASADKAGKAVDGIGAGAEKGAERFTRSEARIRAEIEKSTRALENLGKTASQRLAVKIDTQGLDRARFEPFLAKLREVEESTKKAQSSLGGLGDTAMLAGRVLATLGAGIGVGALTREFFQASDAVTTLNNQLKLATGSTDAAKQAYGSLYEIAQRSRVSFTELGTTYASIARATGEMGISQQRLLKVTESIGNAMTISGGSAQGMQAALVQLGQGFASGTLRGEELNSVMEQTPRLAKAIADGLGISIGKLREMGQAGQLTSEAVVKALESQAAVLQKEVAGATLTVGQAFTQLSNSTTKTIGEFDQATGASGALAEAISSIAGTMDGLGSAFARNEPIIKTTMGALAGGAALASLAALPRAIAAIGGAITGLGAVLTANPVVLGLLGVGAVVGGGVAAVNAYKKTADGIKSTIDALEKENARAQKALDWSAGMGGAYQKGDDRTRQLIADRTAQIAKLRDELLKLESSPVQGAGGGRGTINPPTVAEMNSRQAKDDEALTEARRKLLGVNKDYLADLTKLNDLYNSGAMSLGEYQEHVAKLATDTYKATEAGKAAAKTSGERASAAKAEQSAYDKLIASIQTKLAQNEAEIAGGAKLTDAEKLRIQLTKELEQGSRKMTAARVAEAQAQLALLDASEKSLDIYRAQQKFEQERDKVIQAAAGEIAKINEKAQALEDEAAAYGKTESELQALTIARLEDQKAMLTEFDSTAADEEIAKINERIAALKRLGVARDAMADLKLGSRVDEIVRAAEAEAAAYQDELRLAGLTAVERAKILAERKIELEYAKEIAKVDASGASDEAKADARARLRAAERKAKETAGAKAVADEWQKTADDINRSLTDALLRGFESGKGFAENLRDTLRNMFNTLVLRPIISAIIQPVAGGVTSLIGGVGPSGGGGLGGMDWVNAGMTMWRAFSGGMAASMGAMVTNFGTMFGSQAVTQFGMGMSGMYLPPGVMGPGVSTAAGAAGAGAATLMGWGAGVAGGVFGGRMISGGYSAIGSSGNSAVNVGTVIGALLGGPLGALLGGLAGGVVNRLFGRKLKDSGIEGEFGGQSGFEGRLFEYYKGGLFRSNKTKYKDLDEETRSALGDQFLAMRQGTLNMAEILGLGTDAISNFAAKVKVSLKGLSAEEAQKKLQEEFDKIAESLASTALGTDDFSRKGETAVDTLVRLSTSLSSVNGIFDTLGLSIYDASLSAADAASSFIDLFGGIENLNAAARTYYENFYSPTERRDKQREELDKLFESLGLEKINYDDPEARKKYREIVEREQQKMLDAQKGREAVRQTVDTAMGGIQKPGEGADGVGRIIDNIIGNTAMPLAQEDLDRINGLFETFDAGKLSIDDLKGSIADVIAPVVGVGKSADETVAALLNASGAFAEVTQSSEEAAEASRRAAEEAEREAERKKQEAIRSAYDLFRRAVDRDRDLLQERASGIEEVIGTISGAVDLLKSNARDLYGTVDATAQMLAAQGMVYIEQALGGMRAGGSLVDYDRLDEAISAARGGIDNGAYASQFDRDRDALVLAGQLSELGELGDLQLSIEERQLKAINEQIERLDNLAKRADELVNGTAALTDTVDGYFAKLLALLFPEKQGGDPAKPGAGGPSYGPTWGGDSNTSDKYKRPVGGYTGGTIYAGVSKEEEAKLDKYASGYHAFDGTGDAAGLNQWIKDNNLKPEDLSALSGLYASDWEAWFKANGIPAYEIGTNYVPRTQLALVHQGEAIVPKAFNPWAGGRGMQAGNAELIAEVRALREDNRAQAGQIIRLQGDIAKLMQRWDGDGLPAQRETEAA